MAAPGPSGSATKAEKFALVPAIVVCGFAVAMLGAAALGGLLGTTLGSGVSPVTSTCLGLLSLAILLANREERDRIAARWLAGSMVAVGIAVVVQFLLRARFGVDLPLARLDLAPVTGIQLVLLGLAVVLDDFEGAPPRATELSALLSLAISILVMLGRVSTGADGAAASGVPIGVAALFSLLAIGLLGSRAEPDPSPRPDEPAAAAEPPPRVERRLVAEAAIGRVLADADGVRGAMGALMEGVASTLDWDFATAWTLDRDAGVLRCVEVWQAPQSPLRDLEAVTRDTVVRRGLGLPGRVWAGGESTWVPNLAQDPNFLHSEIATRLGLRTAFAVPVRSRGEFLGVLELFSRELRPRDEALVQTMETVGNQVGQFVERKRVEERLRQEIVTLETVSRLGPLISAELDLEKLVRALTDAATKLVGAEYGTFFRYHGEDGADGHHTAYASSTAVRDAFGLERPGRLLVPTFSSDGPLRIVDLRREARNGDRLPSFGPEAASGSIASYLAVPVVTRSGHVIGSLALAHREPGVFTEREERIAVGIAAQVAVAIDNAQLYESERRARHEAELANHAKDEFLAILGHELRNPLGAIRNSVQALEVSEATTEAGQMLCAIIGRQTETLAHLVDDLLDVSRLISGKIRLRRRLVDWKELTEQALESLRAGGKAARHFVHLSGQSVFVDGDPVRLEQIVTNLLENAIKYTQAGGEIEVAIDHLGEHAQLRVRDNGQGIEPELLPNIFEVFTQGRQSLDRSKGGMGLGLALVRRLVELHGGVIEVESAGPGKGSEFRVRLPARPEPERRAAEPAPGAASVPFVARHVLIVEDHGDSRESLRMLLEASGHHVDVAQNGFDGLELALSKHPEIAILDIGIPGIDGYQLAREIRSADRGDGMYLVALTGYGQPIDRRRALESGFNEHMVKPVDRERLMRIVRDIEA